VGSREWGMGSKKLFPYSPLPIPYSLLYPQSSITYV
jgi:hypothetical protein